MVTHRQRKEPSICHVSPALILRKRQSTTNTALWRIVEAAAATQPTASSPGRLGPSTRLPGRAALGRGLTLHNLCLGVFSDQPC